MTAFDVFGNCPNKSIHRFLTKIGHVAVSFSGPNNKAVPNIRRQNATLENLHRLRHRRLVIACSIPATFEVLTGFAVEREQAPADFSIMRCGSGASNSQALGK